MACEVDTYCNPAHGHVPPDVPPGAAHHRKRGRGTGTGSGLGSLLLERLTSSLRFDGALNVAVAEFQTNLIV